jgi:hypothetical protein
MIGFRFMIYTKVTQTCWFFLYYVYFKRKMYKEAGLHCITENFENLSVIITENYFLSIPKKY